MTLEQMISGIQEDIRHAKECLNGTDIGWQIDEIIDDIEHLEQQEQVLVTTKQKIDRLENHDK